MAVSAGDVVLVPFPYRDRQGGRTRPGVIVSAQAYNQQGDLVIAAITSHPPRFATDFALLDWSAAGLRFPSTVRMLLGTIADSRVVQQIGRLSDRDWAEVQARVRGVFAWP
ncbi:MAG TPA: type II toxin-antitoxin system PemK/MazF family toxin [Gemmataceae bacterium]|jgi:mRNA interferase MazF|nr:type II toxin-antitoxin system PemK/MazF family toxin [Gemmataceae bacterium]